MNEEPTKETTPQSDPDMLSEYDFSKGVRGKHAARCWAATVKNYRVVSQINTLKNTKDS